MLKRDLSWVWVAIAAMVGLLIWLLLQLGMQGTQARVATARARAGVICQIMRAGAARLDLHSGQGEATGRAVIDMALREDSGVEGGLWTAARSVHAYAFPTYDGSGLKNDVPAAELPRIVALAQQSVDSGAAVIDVRPGLREAVLYSACPVAPGVAAWTLTRVAGMADSALNHLTLAVVLLLGSLVLAGAWFAFLLARWGREAQRLSGLLAASERMAALGSLAAGLAHEIRNPLGTIRMKVDNALAATPPKRAMRTEAALRTTLLQVQRLETLVASLLALTQPFYPQRAPVAIAAWLDQCLRDHAEAAIELGVTLDLSVDPALDHAATGVALFDPVQMARVFDNLLSNALAHTDAGGTVTLGAEHGDGCLRFWVADDGSGVAPALGACLFDPLVTGRVGGTGLGLAVVREVVQAHGGTVALAPGAPGGTCGTRGTRIVMVLPWP
ncbi:MAG: HAMP domain-containing histidine kinase [Pseudomonadota bacterium]|nr:HAMP domain-containing histidine kinase [Pseudomonadota bacterium]